MNGDLLAAETPDDNRLLVHLLQRQGVLRRKVAADLEGKLESGAPIFGDLLKYGGAALDTALYHRFENNLATYLGSLGKPEYTELKGVFVDNIQMGHVTSDLIDRACMLWDEASRLDVDTTIIAGSVPFESDQQLWIAKAVGRGERTVSSVLLDLPMEELLARTAILEMLAKGMLAVPGELLEPDEPTDTTLPDDVALDDPDDEELIEDQETVFGIDVAEVKAALEADQAADGADTVLDEPVADDPVPDEAPEAEPDFDSEAEGESESDEAFEEFEDFEEPVVDDETPTAEPIADQVDPLDDARKAFGPSGSYVPNSLNEWKEQASVVDDDELDFFQDHDHDRGSGEQGAFSTESHNLDRVEVVGLGPDPQPQPEAIEVDEAPGAKFSAPVLEESEALEKLDVANEVLANVVRAFDSAEGAGRGRALVQLLTEGSPAKFTVLLSDLAITEEGALPDDQVMANLYSRPPTEHRQLLNSALVDLIERAIGQAADELPDEHFDDMYEAVAGYRQRLGL